MFYTYLLVLLFDFACIVTYLYSECDLAYLNVYFSFLLHLKCFQTVELLVDVQCRGKKLYIHIHEHGFLFLSVFILNEKADLMAIFFFSYYLMCKYIELNMYVMIKYFVFPFMDIFRPKSPTF